MHSLSLAELKSVGRSDVVVLQSSQEDGRRKMLAYQLNIIATRVEKDYLKYYAVSYDASRAASLATAASLLEAIVEVIRMENLNLKKRWFFDDLQEILTIWKVKDLPKSSKRIREKVLHLLESGQKITDVVHPHYEGNANAVRYDDAEIMAWMVVMRDSGKNYTNAFIIRHIQEICTMVGKAIPSQAWFETIFASQEMKMLTTGRYGKRGRRAALYQGYNPVLRAIFGGDCWQVDGSRVNLVNWFDANGKAIFLYVVVIRDLMSGKIIARTYCLGEDRWVYLDVFKQALTNAGYMPHQVVCDQFPGHNTLEWMTFQKRMEDEGCEFTFTSRAQGKAQVERWFSTMQTVFAAHSLFYYGEGVLSTRPHAHRSKEELTTARKQARLEGWNFDLAADESEKILEAYNSTKLCKYSRKWRNVEKSPTELHDSCEKPHVNHLQAPQIARLSWSRTEKKVANYMISPIVDGVEYHFGTEDLNILFEKRVIVCYDSNDLSHVHLFEDTAFEKYLGRAERVWEAQLFGADKDYTALTASKERNKRINKQLAERKEALIAPIQGDSGMLNILMGGFASKADLEQSESEWLKDNLLADDEDRQAAERVRAEDAQEAKIIASELKEAAKSATKAKKAASKKPKENVIRPDIVGRLEDFDAYDFAINQL